MLHYALELKGVLPTKLHHCLMVYTPADRDGTGLMEEVAGWLVDRGTTAASTKNRGLLGENSFAPCKALTARELERVDGLFAQLETVDPPPSQDSALFQRQSGPTLALRLKPRIRTYTRPPAYARSIARGVPAHHRLPLLRIRL
jgi:hypothetical protein